MTAGEKQLNMVLLGPPGAGKGTQAVILVKEYNLLHISTGDMLREAVKEGSEVGKEIQEYMNKGELVPDMIVTKGVIDRMSKPDAAKGIMLDGFPRNCTQAESLGESFAKEGKDLNIVLYFKTSEDVAVQRLSGRRMCPKCNKIYHLTNMPSKEDGICDVCQAELIQREDDQPETIKNRFVVYQNSTKDLLDYYREKDLLCEVNANLSAEELFKKIDKLFREENLIDDSNNV